MNTIKHHWEKFYETKKPKELSWTQDRPATSLNFIHSLNLPNDASIIDIGGGDSNLVDYLLDEGFKNITVLDISTRAIERAKARLKDKAEKITWIVSDIIEFNNEAVYDVWHDRATFHFLTTEEQIEIYINIVRRNISKYLIIATFSNHGPEKCSGLQVTRYSEAELVNRFENRFKKVCCITEDHITPFNSRQNFLFCCFKKIS